MFTLMADQGQRRLICNFSVAFSPAHSLYLASTRLLFLLYYLSVFQMETLSQIIEDDFGTIRTLVFAIQSSSSLSEAQNVADEILLTIDDVKKVILRSVEDTQRSGRIRVKETVRLIKMPFSTADGLLHPVVIFIAQTRHATKGAFGLTWSSTSGSIDCAGPIAIGDVTPQNALLSGILGAVTMAANWNIRRICFISRSTVGLRTAVRALTEDSPPASCSARLIDRIKTSSQDRVEIIDVEGPSVDEYKERHASLLSKAHELAHAALYPKSSINN